jgi:hypothetical protein
MAGLSKAAVFRAGLRSARLVLSLAMVAGTLFGVGGRSALAYTSADCPSTHADYPRKQSDTRPAGEVDVGWQVHDDPVAVYPCLRVHIKDTSGDSSCMEEIHDWVTQQWRDSFGIYHHTHYDARVTITCYASAWKAHKDLERENELPPNAPHGAWWYIGYLGFLADCRRDGPPFNSSNPRDDSNCTYLISLSGTSEHLAPIQDWPTQGDWTDFWIYGTAGNLTVYDDGAWVSGP